MTSYKDFIHDFPGRCGEVLELADGPAQAKGFEVTLLIMTAAAAFVVPFERLSTSKYKREHPSKDAQTFFEHAQELTDALGQPFLGSPFFGDDPASWCEGKIETLGKASVGEPLTKETTSDEVLSIIRNALAHGNLFPIPIGASRAAQMTAIEFYSEDRDGDGKRIGYKFVRVSPRDFRCFLVKWLQFLKEKDILKEKEEKEEKDI